MEILGSILDSLQFNAPSTWIDVMSLDTYLGLERARCPLARLSTLYVPITYHYHPNYGNVPLENRPDPVAADDVQRYRRLMPVPPLPERLPISTLIQNNDHFFGVFIYVEKKAVYIFGQHVNRTYIDMDAGLEWQNWGGPAVLHCLCFLHDIPTFEPVRIIGLNWEQHGGTECGAECGQTLFVTQRTPLTFRDHVLPCRPPSPCTHRFRLDMLRILHETVTTRLGAYCSSTTLSPEQQVTADELRTTWLNPRTALEEKLNTPRTKLQRVMALCAHCLRDAPGRRSNQSALPHALTRDARTPPTIRDLHRAYPEYAKARISSAVKQHISADDSSEHAHGAQAEDPEQPEDPEVVEVSMTHHRQTTLKDNSAATYRKFPQPIPTPVPPEEALAGRRVRFDPSYDAYDEGPSLLSTRLITEDFGLFTHPQIYTFIQSTGIEQTLNPNPFPIEWADFGYRILPDFAQAFDIRNSPWNPADHLFPELPPDFNGTASYQDAPDCWEQSLATFLWNHQPSMPLFPVTGLLSSTPPLLHSRVDPGLDHVEPQKVLLDCDIDSFVAVGKDLPFQESLTMHSLPLHRRKAPLSVHNHVYVEILLPRSDYDINHEHPFVDGLHRSEWFALRYPLSRIPHFELGSFPKRGAQFLMCCPRMIHRQMYLPFHATNIPYDLKTLLYEELLYPALRHAKPPSQHQYFVYSNNMYAHKAGKSQSSLPVDISPQEFKVMCEFMRNKVSEFLY